ncbi:MAG TPA: galactokinase, partial [Blastocatellia bacterium]|nr:galactokinase [Blastocatellia bacterium]
MSTFESLRSQGAQIYRAPGRVNLIGEHTDYNDGFVMPVAIDLYTYVAIKPREDRTLCIHSESFSENCEFDLDESAPRARGHWSDYVLGVAVTLEQAGYRLRGADLEIKSDVPIGAGLSSSAAIEVATGLAMGDNSGIEIDRVELAKLCRQAENEFVGVRCGIMDQFISCCGKAGTALMLDCRSLEYRLPPIPSHVRLVICNTMVKHELAASQFNTRRSECEAAVRHFADRLSGVRALRDVTLDDLASLGSELPCALKRRCRHVISENGRVAEAANAIEVGDLGALGRLMAESHRSLRDDYQVSCEELDVMVELASQVEGVYGSRMTGGGFGGCTINLVKADRVAPFKESITRGYQQATGILPQIIVCSAASGAARH